jgi:membrane protein implicated in regulation of membrane protease activity
MKAMVAIALGLSLIATPALAYIGPGAGITVLGALWGVVVAVVLALAAILLWPLRALLRRRRRSTRPADASASAEPEADAPSSAP